MVELRPYQREAVNALFGYFEDHSGNPLLALPTGSGKSIIQAAFIRETLARWPYEKFLLLTHVKELIEQNAGKLSGLDVGIYSAGLGRRELGHQVTVAGIQSVYKRAHEMGDIGVIIVDEAHLITKTDNTMYQSFLADLRALCPARVVGMSATPFRLDSGPLTAGDNRIFTDIAYQISIKELIEQGYLSSLASAKTAMRVDTSAVKRRGGEYITGDLADCMMGGDNTRAALDEVDALASDRKSLLFFCVSVKHAESVRDALVARGVDTRLVVGDTPKTERAEAVRAFREGSVRAMVSVGVLTTGFDAPNVDCIVCLRPTLSPGLWVQIVGRGSRVAKGKTDCLILDFTNNTHTHGPVDLITVDGDGNVKTAPYRICPECGALNHPLAKVCESCEMSFKKECRECGALVDIDNRVCPDCGEWFGSPRKIDHGDKASDGDIISTGAPTVYEVEDWQFNRHTKKNKPDSMKVTYWTRISTYNTWVCFEHGGYAGSKAAMWWVKNGGQSPTPKTVTEAIERAPELDQPKDIRVKREGKHWTVV